jgi:hypothetical protein
MIPGDLLVSLWMPRSMVGTINKMKGREILCFIMIRIRIEFVFCVCDWDFVLVLFDFLTNTIYFF